MKESLDDVIKSLFNYIGICNTEINVRRDDVTIMEQYKLLELQNSLATKFPEIAKEWHPTKNGNLKPENFTCASGTKIWWMCEYGHEWQAKICARTNGNKCPYCTNRKVLKGLNDFKTWCYNNNSLDLLSEWDYERNDKNGIFIDKITFGFGKKVFWKCKHGHSFNSVILNRIKGNGCPICSGHRKVRCVETGEVYSGPTEVAKLYNIKNSYNISACCKGKQKTAGGYHWEYAD